MENPLLTFASPTIIVGDKSGIGVAIHEIGHSWSGNTFTCSSFRHMWVNEGFTVFVEREILKELHGDEFEKLEAYIGNKSLYIDMIGYGMNSSYSSLYPETYN